MECPPLTRRDIAFLLVAICAVTHGLRAQNKSDFSTTSPSVDSSEVNWYKVGAVSAIAVSGLGASYYYVSNVWWKEDARSFHFDSGPDLHYALNLDKAAHFYGGMIGSMAFKDGLRWAGVKELPAHLLGAAFSSVVQVGIEMKDGYAPRWGFSLWDVGSGALGALYPTAQHYLPAFHAVDVKFSYWNRTNRYYENHPTGQWNDDYINQTYWASFKVWEILPVSARDYWPKWLSIAVGFSLDETTDGLGGGNVEVYLAPDLDITALIPDNSPILSVIAKYLNYLKFPSPALRFSPSFRFHPLYY